MAAATRGKPSKRGSTSSPDVVADVAHTSPRRRATTAPATVDIAGQVVEATLVELTFNVSGSLSGTWVEKLWLANDTRLPVQMERELDLSGPATLKESNKLVLTDLTPTT